VKVTGKKKKRLHQSNQFDCWVSPPTKDFTKREQVERKKGEVEKGGNTRKVKVWWLVGEAEGRRRAMRDGGMS
jgi:hypothetical protein